MCSLNVPMAFCVFPTAFQYTSKSLQHINNNNQAFYSQSSWGRLEMKPREQKKTGTKQERKRREKQKVIKKSNKKMRKDNKTLSQKKTKRGQGKNLTKGNKRKEPKIKVLTHELLASTLLSNASSLVIHQSFKSLFTDSSHVKFDRPLPLFLLPVRLITPLRIGANYYWL
jgi:hypothetical protein